MNRGELWVGVGKLRTDTGVLSESSVVASFGEESLGIYLADDHLLLKAETLTAGDETAVFVDEGVASKDNVLSALTESAGTIDITSDATCALLTDEGEKVLIFSDELVGCTQVEDDFCSLQHQFAARRHRCPKVFTNLDSEAGLLSVEENVVSERNRLRAEVNLSGVSGSG